MLKFYALQEKQARIARKMLGKENNSPITVRTARASIPCNPNTIYDIGNLKNPVYVVQEVTKPKDMGNLGNFTPELGMTDVRENSRERQLQY